MLMTTVTFLPAHLRPTRYSYRQTFSHPCLFKADVRASWSTGGVARHNTLAASFGSLPRVRSVLAGQRWAARTECFTGFCQRSIHVAGKGAVDLA